MTPVEAAKILGCDPSNVRAMIRSGKITKFKKVPSRHNQFGYEYDIPKDEVKRVGKIPQKIGYPRGKPRS